MDSKSLMATFAGLKGASAACLLVLQHADEPLSAKDLGLITGYSAATVEHGLALLEARQLVARTVQGFSALQATELHAIRQQSNRFSALDPPHPDGGDELAKNFFPAKKIFLPSSSSSTQDDLLSVEEEEEEAASRQEILRLLAKAGIGHKSRKAQEIAQAGLAVDYVQAHVDAHQAAVARGERYPAGWLINKLLSGDPAPAPPPPPTASGCTCGQCAECRLQRIYAKYPHIKR
jgi:hypothetical protein